MSSLLSSHFEQISLCATSIAELPFPGPRRFTNAILSNHDITALIRDTEVHERALFHLAAPEVSAKASGLESGHAASSAASAPNRRATVYASRQPKNKAVAAVLGGDLYAKIQRQPAGRQTGELDVELLLQGAERLAAVYPIHGAADRISQLRRRYQQLEANIAHYERRAAEQKSELERINRPSESAEQDAVDNEQDTSALEDGNALEGATMTQADWAVAEEEVKDLERKKKSLEDRVTGMERDLGGLMR